MLIRRCNFFDYRIRCSNFSYFKYLVREVGGMPNLPEDPVKEIKLSRFELKALEQNLQQALDDAIARGVLTAPINTAIGKLIAHLRARQQAAAL